MKIPNDFFKSVSIVIVAALGGTIQVQIPNVFLGFIIGVIFYSISIILLNKWYVLKELSEKKK